MRVQTDLRFRWIVNISSPLMGGVLLLLLAIPLVSTAQEETLQIDGFSTGQPVNFQAGFFTEEMGAVRLVPTLNCPCKLESITLVYGGGTGTFNVGVHIWNDVGTVDPGSQLFNGTSFLTGSNDSLNLIDLSAEDIEVNGPIRVGIEMLTIGTGGLPSLATDVDGINAPANFIYAFSLSLFDYEWKQSSDFGVSGDWIIRATISEVAPAVPTFSLFGTAILLSTLIATALIAVLRHQKHMRSHV